MLLIVGVLIAGRRRNLTPIDCARRTAYNAIVSLHGQDWAVDTLEKLPNGVQPQISVEDLALCEEIIKRDERVIKLAAEVGLCLLSFDATPRIVVLTRTAEAGIKPDQLFADGWAIGYDPRFPESKRIQQALVFARLDRHENLYAHPLVSVLRDHGTPCALISAIQDFTPVVDSIAEKVIHIDFPPHYKPKTSEPLFEASGLNVALSTSTTAPPPLEADSLAEANRPRVPPPLKSHDWLPDYLTKDKNFRLRDDIKPLHVLQPEGVSFKVDGHVLEWQKWKMHVCEPSYSNPERHCSGHLMHSSAFHHREGLAISTITYDDNGVVRPIFYRLALSEMVVPYGAPEHPHPRKHAFDVYVPPSTVSGSISALIVLGQRGVRHGHDGEFAHAGLRLSWQNSLFGERSEQALTNKV